MKKSLFTVAGCMVLAAAFTACGGQKKTQEAAEETAAPAATTTINVSTTPNGAETQALELPIDADGYITIFDGKTFKPSTAGVVMARTRFLLAGPSRMAASSSTVQAQAKARPLVVVT